MIVKRMLSSADMLIAILLAVRRDLCFNTTTIMTQKELDKQSVRVAIIFTGGLARLDRIRGSEWSFPKMQGNPKVIAELNSALKEELTAISQYFLHAEMCENWKYDKLGSFIKKQSIDEMKHAEALIERILFLDGAPNLTELLQLSVGGSVKEQLENDLRLEINAVAMYNKSIQIARDEGDNASRELFDRLLKDEESHVDWLEAQLHQIKELGYKRYLSQQIREDK